MCDFAGDVAFGEHTSASERRFPRLYVFREFGTGFGRYFGNDTTAGIVGISVIYPVDVAEDYQGFGSHHGSDHAREFIVVGEHQFRYRYSVVLVDDGYDAVFEHDFHAMLLVEIVAAGGEIFFHREDLSAGDTVFPEQFVVSVDQFGLPHGRKS